MSGCRAEGDAFTFSFHQQKYKTTKGDFLMKRFLAVLVASMFLTSAAYAASDAMKDEKKAAEKSEKKAGKSKGDAKKTDGKAKSEEKKSEKAK
jgi:hypothetical protein